MADCDGCGSSFEVDDVAFVMTTGRFHKRRLHPWLKFKTDVMRMYHSWCWDKYVVKSPITPSGTEEGR